MYPAGPPGSASTAACHSLSEIHPQLPQPSPGSTFSSPALVLSWEELAKGPEGGDLGFYPRSHRAGWMT